MLLLFIAENRNKKLLHYLGKATERLLLFNRKGPKNRSWLFEDCCFLFSRAFCVLYPSSARSICCGLSAKVKALKTHTIKVDRVSEKAGLCDIAAFSDIKVNSKSLGSIYTKEGILVV